jgi:antitoxin component YwqK of YwqJK toxin-antitoxin module
LKKEHFIVVGLFIMVNSFAQTDIPDQSQRKTKYILYSQELDKSRPSDEKVQKKYYKNGKLAEVSYSDSLKMEFYENGTKRSVTKFRKGKIEGERMYYYASGQEEMMVHYRRGMQDGPFALFYENGKIKYKGTFKADHIYGERYCYDEKGNLLNGDFTLSGFGDTKYEGKAIDGKPEGEVKVSDGSGLIMTVNFKNGKAHGLVYHYQDGKKIKAENYAEGLYVDDVPMDMSMSPEPENK